LLVEALDSVASQFEVVIQGSSEIARTISTDLELSQVLETEWWGQELQLREREQSKLRELFQTHCLRSAYTN
jgi:predicted secreted hydrolase